MRFDFLRMFGKKDLPEHFKGEEKIVSMTPVAGGGYMVEVEEADGEEAHRIAAEAVMREARKN